MGVKKANYPISSMSPAIVYSRFVYDYPLTVFLLGFLLSGVLPVALLYYFPLQLDSNPEKGFDTRDTVYAGPRLAWAALQPSLLLGSRVIVNIAGGRGNATVLPSTSSSLPKSSEARTGGGRPKRDVLLGEFGAPVDKEFLTLLDSDNLERLKRQTALGNWSAAELEEREKRSWADDLLSSFSSVACYDQPIPAMNYLSQLVITVPEYEDMYSMDFLNDLCALHHSLADEIRSFDHLTPYRSVWHVANYFACLAPESRLNCSYLTSADVTAVRADLEACTLHRKAIVNCRRSCEFHQSLMQEIQNADAIAKCDASCKKAGGVASKCMGQMMSDLFYRVLPKDLMAHPLHLNIFLPFYTFASYRMQGYDIDLAAFIRFQQKVETIAGASKTFKLKGMLMDVKRDILFDAAISDSKFSLIAGACVFALIALYSLSLTYSLVVLAQLALSVLSALCFYRIFNVEFPLLNLIVFVLLISIGSDGAFLLFSGFPSAEQLNHFTFHKCLRHTATTMFLTQFSTVVPFLLNVLSSVVAFRSFGLFAGLTLITNYFLLISFLPAFLVIQLRYVNPWLVRRLPSSLWYCFPSFSFSGGASAAPPKLHAHHISVHSASSARRHADALVSMRKEHISYSKEAVSTHFERFCSAVQTLLREVLPVVLIQGRLLWIGSLAVVLVLSAAICATQLRLPQYNPLQLFVDSNPHEFYDNYAEKLFHFVSTKVALPLSIRLVWGIESLRSLDHFNPQYLSPLTANARFRLGTARQLRQLAAQLTQFRAQNFIQHPHKFWPERYLEWSERLACDDSEAVCCNLESVHYSDTYLDYCMRVSTAQLQTQYNDTPIYHNITFELVGYTALLPTKLKYSHRYANLSDSFRQFDDAFRSEINDLPLWYTTEWHLMSTWFDLQRSIIADCKQSVVISSLVVLVFAATILRWKCVCAMITIPSIIVTTTGTVVFFGWEIGVLEGVILVLVVGLSFDYTLHYGAAIPHKGCAAHRVQISVRKATLPVAMAALSSIIAGAVMLFAQTHAFFQVAVFLVVSTSMSFLFATFFFLPLFYVFLPQSEASECKMCTASAQNFPLKTYRAPPPAADQGRIEGERGG